jgi:hypothetical protein
LICIFVRSWIEAAPPDKNRIGAALNDINDINDSNDSICKALFAQRILCLTLTYGRSVPNMSIFRE